MGNLRTALAARLAVPPVGRFLVRIEDLDPVASGRATADGQLRDLAALGIVSDEAPVRQSNRFDLYQDALATLAARDLVYECYCTRREIREAVAAPHGADGAYPGTCRELSVAARRARARERSPAIRLRTDGMERTVHDVLHGAVSAPVTDVVLRRNDGVPAYNLAVVVDDAHQGITQVVRGADLLAITPSQDLIRELLGFPVLSHLHVPLVVGPDGERLAKRHGAVTMTDLAAMGWSAGHLRDALVASLGQREHAPFDVAAVPRTEWVFDPRDSHAGMM